MCVSPTFNGLWVRDLIEGQKSCFGGVIQSDRALRDLRTAVDGTKPPFYVNWRFVVTKRSQVNESGRVTQFGSQHPAMQTAFSGKQFSEGEGVMSYYLLIDDKSQGPYDIGQIRQMLKEGTITTQTLWHSGRWERR